MDGHTTVRDFSALRHVHVWWNILAVRVLFVWDDVEHDRLLIWLLDRNRDKMIAIVPRVLRSILNMNLVGRVISLNHFRMDHFYKDHPRYQHYKIFFGEWDNILVSTALTDVTLDPRMPEADRIRMRDRENI
ncbi:unnamed protein product [Lactuca virosa]|uniref:Uncharacterized protein n=1 Tax=Lactuca virosa TaxID=75947 RepID=A0AAU9NZR0_9ASTR|nr:unnamed protein product [Lactuca virosa]